MYLLALKKHHGTLIMESSKQHSLSSHCCVVIALCPQAIRILPDMAQRSLKSENKCYIIIKFIMVKLQTDYSNCTQMIELPDTIFFQQKIFLNS